MNTRRGSGTRKLSDVRRVLIVDDNEDCARLLTTVLEREGHETRVAHGGQEAILLALAFRPNVALLDIGLPGMDGFQLLDVLRGHHELAACKFVAVTGYEQLELTSRGLAFDAHLVKPVDLDQVVAVVLEVGRAHSSSPASA